MRKKISLILICVACLTFGGCFIEQAPLNDKEMGIVAQYAADILLKHNKNYSDFLLTLEQLTPTPTRQVIETTKAPTSTPKPTAVPSNGPNPSDGPVATPMPTDTPVPTEIPDNTKDTFKQMAKVIGADGFDVDFLGADKPVKEGSFSVGGESVILPARTDGKLYHVVRFSITNNTDSTKNLSCFDQEKQEPSITCVLSVNGKKEMYPSDTLCLNDLRFIGVGNKPEVLAAGQSYESVLIFAIDKDTEVEKVALTLTNKEKESVVIKIK